MMLYICTMFYEYLKGFRSYSAKPIFTLIFTKGQNSVLELLSRDNLSSPLFALETNMISFYKVRSEIQGQNH